MSTLREEDFLAALDDRGILRPGALEPPPRSACYTVFAQRADARVEAETWRRHAAQFFGTELSLAPPKDYAFDPPPFDAARVEVRSPNEPRAVRTCYGRPATRDDHLAAEEAELVCRTSGMARLAQRCGSVWLVEAGGATDLVSLLVAAVLASVVLGPILTPDGKEIFGVRTARVKLDEKGGPYRG